MSASLALADIPTFTENFESGQVGQTPASPYFDVVGTPVIGTGLDGNTGKYYDGTGAPFGLVFKGRQGV